VLAPPLLAVLRSLLARLIPADDWPGALEAGVESYLFRQWSGDCAPEFAAISLGLAQLNAESAARHANVTFPELSPVQQDDLLKALENGGAVTAWPGEISATAFLDRMIALAHEGFYADPSNGVNRDAVSWQMLRYDPRMPKAPDRL
jgi:hypothetical protein